MSNLPHQLTSAILERDNFKKQLDSLSPFNALRNTGPSILKQMDTKIKDLQDEMRRQEPK